MNDEKKGTPDTVGPENTPAASHETDERGSSDRRGFVKGVAAVGAGIIGVGAIVGKSEVDAAQIRSRIMARIQDELREAKEDELHSFDKTDFGHSKYVKA